MPKSIIIVESPTKARTLAGFLGRDFVVESSFGHVRDLPKSQLGIDVEHDFEPKYVIPPKAKQKIKELKAKVEKTDAVILATDEDREGEAIAWHLTQALDLGEGSRLTAHGPRQKGGKVPMPKAESRKPKAAITRIVFHEITKRAIEEALRNPRTIDMHLVDAQQARRILDRLVGYKLSPFLWKKIYRGLSAGRVQSVAVRLVVEREREIQQFKPQEYWTIEASLKKRADSQRSIEIKDVFTAFLVKIGEKTLKKFDIASRAHAQDIVKALDRAEWRVASLEKRSVQKKPLPPHTTSTLQQDAFRRLGFSAKQTMMIAQQLYEGMRLGNASSGLITYMRTDSLHMAEDALSAAAAFLSQTLGNQYALPAPRRFKTKSKGAQEAHEAIRPTDPFRTPESVKNYLDSKQYRLYDLIWRRFIATQMPAAIFDATTVDISAAANRQPSTTNPYTFRSTGQTLTFDGFLKVYPLKFAETDLPPLKPQEELTLAGLVPRQHFTEPQPRYTEASLVKTLEQNGIGRPSTYAPTIATIQERGYVERNEKRALVPTETGFLVNDILVEHFPEIVDIQFTARMEEDLDKIAQGKRPWRPVIRTFYEPFAKQLTQKYEEVKKREAPEQTDEVCERCGKPMTVKMGRFGKFLACTGFPECKTTKPIKQEPETTGLACPKCETGVLVVRRTKKWKRIFYGCSRYPNCDYATWEDPRTQEKEENKKGARKESDA